MPSRHKNPNMSHGGLRASTLPFLNGWAVFEPAIYKTFQAGSFNHCTRAFSYLASYHPHPLVYGKRERTAFVDFNTMPICMREPHTEITHTRYFHFRTDKNPDVYIRTWPHHSRTHNTLNLSVQCALVATLLIFIFYIVLFCSYFKQVITLLVLFTHFDLCAAAIHNFKWLVIFKALQRL